MRPSLFRRLATGVGEILDRRSAPRCMKCGAREDLARVSPDTMEMLCRGCFSQGWHGSSRRAAGGSAEEALGAKRD